MANANNPHGLMWLGIALSGGPCLTQELPKAAGYGTAIFRGDPVYRVAGGNLQADITPGTTLFSGVSLNYGAASTATTHSIIVTPDAIFEAQSGATGIVTANLGKNSNIVLAAGSTVTKMSGATIDETTVATTATLDLHLMRFYSDAVNASGAYSRVEVVINKSRLANGVAGV